ncbi:MAG: hypothetical protein Q4C18_03725 [Eubacteriales bacterium]|nr:hypothetical protein [Eubacteriales bacterium]
MLIVSYVVGLFGFAQILGSLQHVRERGIAMTFITIIINGVILLGAYMLVAHFFTSVKPLVIGYVISFLSLLGKPIY